MNKKIHVVPHFHWDREWYFTTSRSKVYLMNNFKNVIDTLESDPDFKYFLLDGQASLLDDFIKWNKNYKDRIKKLVKDKKLIIGPWYTQTDQLVISGESIVRNLYYGIKKCEEFGGYMNVGYVPDSFGQAGNMPQIYRQFGIEDTLFWRGVSDDMVKHTDFNWKGDDGSVVFTTQIPFGYYIGGNIPEKKEDSIKFWNEECFEKAGSRSSTRHIYFPNGFDQAPIRTNLPTIIKELNERDTKNEYVISSIEDYIKDVKNEKPELEEVEGELVIAKHMRIHKSIFSSRSDLKKLNTETQNYIVNVLEPILTIANELGFDYPHEAVEEIWKLMFENAAHDSIGSCISDTANEDVYLRYKQVKEIAINLVELYSRLISTNVSNNSNKMTLTAINPYPSQRNDVVVIKTYVPGDRFSIIDSCGNKVKYSILSKKNLTDYVLSQTIRLNPSVMYEKPEVVYEMELAIELNKVPALGYTQFTLDFNESSIENIDEVNCLENEYYKITIEQNGSLTIYDKSSNYTYVNQAILVDNGDDGDSFNYSPPRNDYEVFSTDFKPNITISGSDIIQNASIKFEMHLPYDLNEREKKVTSSIMPVEMKVSLKKGSDLIYFKVSLDNTVLSHRMCVLFDSQLATKFNYADQQFGAIKRPNEYTKEMKLYAMSNGKEVHEDATMQSLANWANDQSTWQEPPISIEPTQSYVSLTDNSRGIAVIPKGVREYEIIGDDKNIIRLSLFRTYGFMGKENLVYRPGRASGEKIIETPDAQLLKEMTYEFGFTTYNCDFNSSMIDLKAKLYNSDIVIYSYAPFLNGRLIFSQQEVSGTNANKFSLFETKNRLSISAIKKTDKNNNLLIRLYNGKYKKPIDDIIIFNQKIKAAYYTNLKEDKIEQIEVNGNILNIKELTHCQFVTICVEL